MSNSDSVWADPVLLGDHWFNGDAAKFAFAPRPGKPAIKFDSNVVAVLVERYRKADTVGLRTAILAELLDLHRHGTLLWPIGALFGHSALGAVDMRGVYAHLSQKRSDLLCLVDDFEVDADSPFAGYKEPQKRAYSYSAWKCLLALRLATTRPLASLGTHEHDDIEFFASVVRPSGEWAEWFPSTSRKAVQYVVGHLAATRNDPHLGASLVRLVNPNLPGKRNPDPFKFNPHLAWLDALYEQWLDETKVLMKKGPRSGKRLLGEFFATLPKGTTSSVDSAFNIDDMQRLQAFAKTWSTPIMRVQAMGRINDFLDFIERQHRAGAIKTSGLLQLGLEKKDVDHFTKSVYVPPRASLSGEVQARPMPARYHILLKEIITADDFAWPKSLRNAVNGRPLHWIPWRDPATGRTREVFCPVLPRLLLLQLDLPLRNVQARRLDSGEGDVERWDPGSGTWGLNEGPHAARWKRMGAGNQRRGCIRRIPIDDGRHLTGIWVNSNKTQDRGVLFDDTAGYEIPWEHADVLQNLAAMRAWQETYNPVAGPLPHAELPPNIFADEPSEAVRQLIPDRFYLFRYPPNPGLRGNEAPPSYAASLQFFFDALEELEKRLTAEDPDHPVTIINGRDHSGAPKRAIYTLHGMRSSTLTSLHMAGVPIEMLSKVVAGHASILMTLNYVKFDPAHVSQVLSEARIKAADEAKAAFPDLLRNANMEEAIRMTARLADDGLGQLKGSYSEPSAWLRLDVGLCPNGGTQCRIGGEAIQRRNDKGVDKSAYGPVPGGPRNCVRCRFFVTGLPFLIPLWAHGTAIMARADAIARQAADRALEVRELKQRRKATRDAGEGVPTELNERIKVTDELWISDCERRDQALADFHATLALIEKVRAISQASSAAGDEARIPMLLPGEDVPHVVARESTRFEVADAVVQASRCFPSLESDDVERERDEFLNQILHRSGYVPITMAPLTKSERREAADAMAALLLVELGATEAEHLIAGRKTLADLGLQSGLEAACRKAIGRPLERLVAPSAEGRHLSRFEIAAAE